MFIVAAGIFAAAAGAYQLHATAVKYSPLSNLVMSFFSLLLLLFIPKKTVFGNLSCFFILLHNLKQSFVVVSTRRIFFLCFGV